MAHSTNLYKISRSELSSLQVPSSASITDVKHLSSYSWLGTPSATPTIAVPGCPALWRPLNGAQRLQKDSGCVYIAPNAVHHPENPLEPLFRALYVAQPAYDIRTANVVTDRNNIRKLLSFVDPATSKSGLEDFTIDIEMKGTTAIFCRTDTETMDFIQPHEFKGYNQEFEKAYTIPQVNDATSHHRIISYRFGGLNFIVRHETDSYVSGGSMAAPSDSKPLQRKDLSNMLGGLSLSSDRDGASKTSHVSKLRIEKLGRRIPLESILAIKTRVFHKPLDFDEIAAQLWISQTTKLVRAYHHKGTFQYPTVEDVAANVRRWEERKQQQLKTVAALIRKIISCVSDLDGKATLNYDKMYDWLVISKAYKKDLLPADLHSKWEASEHTEAENIDAAGKDLESGTTTKTTNGGSMASIKVGNKDYTVDIVKMPFFAPLVHLQQDKQPEAQLFVHRPINLFDVALKGVESGYRHCIRSLPTDLSQYNILFDTYKVLGVDVLGGLTTKQVTANLKPSEADHDPEERRKVPGNRTQARDSAFQLLYIILHPSPGNHANDSQRIYHAVKFVVSHPRTFEFRARKVVRAAYDEKFRPSVKQKMSLDQWNKDRIAGDLDEETNSD